MKINDIITEAAPGLSGLDLPNKIIKRLFQTANLPHDAEPQKLNRKPNRKDIAGGALIVKNKQDEVTILYPVRGRMSNDKWVNAYKYADGKMQSSEGLTMAAASKIAGTGEYWYVPAKDGETSRRRDRLDKKSDQTRAGAREAQAYMKKVFSPKLQSRVEEYLDYIYANLRNLPDNDRSAFTSDRQNALKAATRLEKLAKGAFSFDDVEDFLAQSDLKSVGFASIPKNEEAFVEIMKQPNSAAKFAKLVFSRAKDIYNEVKRMVGQAKQDQ